MLAGGRLYGPNSEVVVLQRGETKAKMTRQAVPGGYGKWTVDPALKLDIFAVPPDLPRELPDFIPGIRNNQPDLYAFRSLEYSYPALYWALYKAVVLGWRVVGYEISGFFEEHRLGLEYYLDVVRRYFPDAIGITHQDVVYGESLGSFTRDTRPDVVY